MMCIIMLMFYYAETYSTYQQHVMKQNVCTRKLMIYILIAAMISALCISVVYSLSSTPPLLTALPKSPQCRIQQSRWLTVLHNSSALSSSSHCMLPVIFKMSNATSRIENKEIWSSKYFFIFPQRDFSNRLTLHVTVDKQYLSVYVLSPWSDTVTVNGMITVKILNPYCDQDHYSRSFEVHNTNIAADKRLCDGTNFISLYMLRHNYLKNDTIYFEVSYSSTAILDSGLDAASTVAFNNVLIFCVLLVNAFVVM